MFRSLDSLAVALIAVACFAALDASSEIYRYTDAEGKRHVVSDLGMIPAEYREAAVADAKGRSGGSVNLIDTGSPAKAPAAPAAAAATPAPTGTPSQNEGWWRSQSREKHLAVEDARTALEAVEQAEEDDITSDTLEPVRVAGSGGHHGRPGPRHDRYYGDDDDEGPSVDDLQGGLARAERDLRDFEEQARTGGVPAGWLR
jgi:hypothetical protein